MSEEATDGIEFTDEQLRAALARVGRDARQATFAAGLPVVIVRGSSLVAVHADGREEVLECLSQFYLPNPNSAEY